MLTSGVGAPHANGDEGNPSADGAKSGPYANGIDGGHQEWWQWCSYANSIKGTPHGNCVEVTLVPMVARAHLLKIKMIDLKNVFFVTTSYMK